MGNTGRTKTRIALTVLVTLIGMLVIGVIVSCAGGGSGASPPSSNSTTANQITGCEKMWSDAAAISDFQDSVEDLDPAIRACKSLQEWTSAAAKYPLALDGVDPVLFLSNRCFYGSQLGTLCQWLVAHPESIDQNSALAIATRFADVSSQPTTAPVPSAASDPLIAEIEAYFSAVEQFVTLHPEISEEIWGQASRYGFVGGSADWKTELSELLNQDVQLYEEWVDIEPPEPFRGFHETFARGLAISGDLRDLFMEWVGMFAADPANVQPPWERVAAFTSDRQRVLTNSLEALAYGNAVYAELTDGEELNFTVENIFGIAVPAATPTETPTPSPTANPATQSFGGTGDSVLGPINISEGVLLVSGRHSGSGNFQVTVIGSDSTELSFNEIGNFVGSVAHPVSQGSVFGLEPGSVLIEVTADGSWSIDLTQGTPTGGQSPPLDWESRGQNVVRWLRFPSGNYVLGAQHQGSSNFQVFLLKSDGTHSETVINEIGNYSGENLLQVSSGNLFGMNPGLYALAVVADGDWSISIR